MSKLGCGSWEAYLATRGGASVLAQIPFSDLNASKRLDDAGSANLSLPVSGPNRSACCDVLELAEPWEHEVICYRDGDLAFAGPVVDTDATPEGGTIQCFDGFYWMERRFLDADLFLSADASDVFEAIFEAAMSPDPSPNFSVVAKASGTDVVREIAGRDFQRASDLLRELARTAVDFTTIGRQIVVGGKDIFTVGIGPGVPLIVHDDGVSAPTVNKDGSQFASDVAVFAESDSASPADRIIGRATRSVSRYGLVQSSFSEPLIRDTPSADANALARLEQMQPTPRRVAVAFTSEAAFGFDDLIPGRHADMRISQAAGCVSVMEMMRLMSVDITVSNGGKDETITGNIVPLGLADIEGA